MKYTIIKYIRVIVFLIILIVTVSAVVYFLYALSFQEIDLFGILFVNPVFKYVVWMPEWLYLVLCVSLLFLVVAFALTSLSLFYDQQRGRSARLKAKYFRYFTYLLSNYFVSGRYASGYDKKNFLMRIEPYIRTKIHLTAFLESYLRLQELVADNLSSDFKALIDDLNLQKKIESFLFHKNFDNRILSMKVLSYLRITTSIDQIKILAGHKNFVLRTEAYAALIRLMNDDDFLIHFIGENHNLSLIDINIVVNAVLKNRKMDIDYGALLFSENPRKIMIGLLLAKYRYEKSNDNIQLLINHIGNPNLKFNRLAWDALLSAVPQKEAVSVILERFDQQPDEVKLLILQNAHDIMDQRFYDFLADNLEQQSVLVKVEAMKLFFENDFSLLSTFESSPNVETKMVYNETACMYINK